MHSGVRKLQALPCHFIIESIAGDLDAYWKVIAGYQDYLYRIAFLHTKNEDDALDAVYDAILKGYNSIWRLRKPEYFKTWITKILINCIMDDFRKRKKIAVFRDNPGVEKGLETAAISADNLDLYRTIDMLKYEEKTAIILRYFAGFDLSEIAQIMNYTTGGIKSLLHRARKKLHQHL